MGSDIGDAATVQKDWNAVMELYNTTLGDKVIDESTVNDNNAGDLAADEEEVNGGAELNDVIDRIFSKIETEQQNSASSTDKNLIMSWFWAGYYQGEQNARLKYESILRELKAEIQKNAKN